MPHSLKSKVKSLCYKGEITEKERDRIIQALEQQSSEDCISREDAKNLFWDGTEGYDCRGFTRMEIGEMLDDLPSVTPKFTDTEIQKIQELEQIQLEKAYELGKTEMQPCDDCISRTKLLSRIDAERKHLLDLKMDGAEHIIVHHARRIIEDMPSVTPQAESGDKK